MSTLFGLLAFFALVGIIYPTKLHKKAFVGTRLRSLGAFILFAAIAGAAGGDDTQSTPVAQDVQDAPKAEAEADKPEKKAEPAPKAKAPGIGDEVKAGDMTVKVTKAENRAQISGALGTEKPASGNFAVVTVEVKNNGKKPATVDSTQFKLIGKDGSEYNYSVEGSTALTDGDDPFLQNINPNGKRTYKIPFDISGKAKDFALQFQDGMFLPDNTVKIALK